MKKVIKPWIMVANWLFLKGSWKICSQITDITQRVQFNHVTLSLLLTAHSTYTHSHT